MLTHMLGPESLESALELILRIAAMDETQTVKRHYSQQTQMRYAAWLHQVAAMRDDTVTLAEALKKEEF